MATSVRLSLTANRLYIIRRRKLNQNYMNLHTYVIYLQDYDRNSIRRTHFNFLFTWTGGWYWIWKCWFLHGSSWMYPLRNQKVLGTDSKPRCVCSRRASQSNSSLNLDFFPNSLIWIFFPSLKKHSSSRIFLICLRHPTHWETKDYKQVWSLVVFRAVVIKWSY